MTAADELFLGEWVRSVDERHRLSFPPEWAERLAGADGTCMLAKERPGCLSVWNADQWERWWTDGIDLLRAKLRGGRLGASVDDVQALGRLMSTRYRSAPIAGRGRLAVPDSFRDFLGVEPGGDVLVVGAAICVEIWRPDQWAEHIGASMPGFRKLFNKLTK